MNITKIKSMIVDVFKIISVIKLRDSVKLLLPVLGIPTYFKLWFLGDSMEVRVEMKGDFHKIIVLYDMLRSRDYRLVLNDDRLRIYIPRFHVLSRPLTLSEVIKLYDFGILRTITDFFKWITKHHRTQHGHVLEFYFNSRRMLFAVSDLSQYRLERYTTRS